MGHDEVSFTVSRRTVLTVAVLCAVLMVGGAAAVVAEAFAEPTWISRLGLVTCLVGAFGCLLIGVALSSSPPSKPR